MITGFYAALLGLMFLVLSYRVIGARRRYGVALGDGGHPDLTARIRVQGNFAENIPLGLLLMLLVEMRGAPLLSIHAMGIILIVGRVSHAYALQRSVIRWRVTGMVLTHIVILSCCVFLIWKFMVQSL